jgi:alkylated DNA repair dioxygenase AlkB
MAIQFQDIPGLYLIPDAFTKEENNFYMDILEKENTYNPNICHQIHKATEYGWKFLPVTKKSDKDFLGNFPDWLENLWQKIFLHIKANIPNFPEKSYPDNVLINQYEPGDGCYPHIDQLNFWDNWVVGVSFGSGCTFQFTKEKNNNNKISFYMPHCSIYIMIDEARYLWKHEMIFSPIDNYYGEIIPRTKRISLTFRTMNDEILDKETKNKRNEK